jgi:hypothetical protein
MQPRQQHQQYEIAWEKESDLSERIAAPWGESGAKHDLADIIKGLDQVMSTLQA